MALSNSRFGPTSPLVLSSLSIRTSRPTTLSTEWCGEGRSFKVHPSTRPGIEPETFWLVVRDLTNCARLTHMFVWFTTLRAVKQYYVVNRQLIYGVLLVSNRTFLLHNCLYSVHPSLFSPHMEIEARLNVLNVRVSVIRSFSGNGWLAHRPTPVVSFLSIRGYGYLEAPDTRLLPLSLSCRSILARGYDDGDVHDMQLQW